MGILQWEIWDLFSDDYDIDEDFPNCLLTRKSSSGKVQNCQETKRKQPKGSLTQSHWIYVDNKIPGSNKNIISKHF